MGGAVGLLSSNKPPEYALFRRKPLSRVQDILNSPEGQKRLNDTLDMHPPGTPFRWERMLKLLLTDLAPTKEQNDPIRFDITLNTFKEVLQARYNAITSSVNNKIILLRTYMPELYDQYTVDIGRKISQFERERLELSDDSYCYGELHYEIYATMYEKITRIFGILPAGGFFDLGCGSGQLVFANAMISGDDHFNTVGGIEVLSDLFNNGALRMARWEMKFKQEFPNHTKKIQFQWENGNIFASKMWHTSTFFLVHWTAFKDEQVQLLSRHLRACKEGSFIITLTHKILETLDDFELLITDTCATSWGETTYYVYEKVTMPKLPYEESVVYNE